jgi:transposase InsO family protein
VTRAAFYKSLKRSEPKTGSQQRSIVAEIRRIHAIPRLSTYGSPRVHKELVKFGWKCCENTVAKLMRKVGIRAATAMKFKPMTTDSKHADPIAPNRLDQDFTAKKPNRVWLTDFTYIPIREGFTYLCTIQDLFSRRIVGWSTSRKVDSALAIQALNQAIALRQPAAGLIVHSDRGSQFASQAYRGRLSSNRFLQSMSRKGNCYDNAPMESFFKSFKSEEVYRKTYQTHEEATRAVADYIDRFYNRQRLHSALGYFSPNDYERRVARNRTVV